MSAHITLIGYVGKDAEVREGREGKSYVSFSLSSFDNRSKDTTWYRVTSPRPGIAQYLTKGKHLQVHGTLKAALNESNGKSYMNLDVFADSIEFLDRKEQGGSVGSSAPPTKSSSNAPDTVDDDIPFLRLEGPPPSHRFSRGGLNVRRVGVHPIVWLRRLRMEW